MAANKLQVLLNQQPPELWLCEHPMSKTKYLPIQKVEYLLTRIYPRWWVEVRSVQLIANSVVVTVRLFVHNPITGEIEHNDGVGASPIQTDKGAGAVDFNAVKSIGVQLATPSAKSYAIKDAAEQFGEIFGRSVSRKDVMDYTSLLVATESDIVQLFNEKQELLAPEDRAAIKHIIDTKEEISYQKAFNKLRKL